jgi:carbamoyl-phosphate synthase large subunit
MNILITSAGKRVGLLNAFKYELKRKFPASKVYTADSNPEWSSACRLSDGYFQMPKVIEKNYVSKLLQACIEHQIKIVIPTIDTELIVLANAKDIFLSHNIDIVISDICLITKCRDKRETNKIFNELGIDVPSEIDKVNPSFPLFIKPYDGSLSKGVYLIKSKEELTDYLINDPRNMFMEYINPDYFDEYTIDAYYDKKGLLKCLVPRRRIEVRAGEICKGKTEKSSFYFILKDKLRFLKGAIGCLTFQFFIGKHTNKIIGIEINPRFGGGFPLSYSSGANYPAYIIQEYLLKETIPFNDSWIENRVMLRFDSELFLDKNDFTN